jgi:hypothetical protein
MRCTLIVESLEVPVELDSIVPVVALRSRQLIFIFAAGEARYPDNAIDIKWPALSLVEAAAEITVVPSHNLQIKSATVAESDSVTLPDAHHVPDVPWATLGPSKKLDVLLSETLPDRIFDAVVRLTEHVPVFVIVPPLNPVPHATEVTVPVAGAPPSCMTLPVVPANVATCPVVELAGPVTSPPAGMAAIEFVTNASDPQYDVDVPTGDVRHWAPCA